MEYKHKTIQICSQAIQRLKELIESLDGDTRTTLPFATVDNNTIIHFEIDYKEFTGQNIYGYVDYHEYIKSENWKRKAKSCYRRARYRCQICASTDRQLQAHHNTYANLGHEKPEDLICLCDLCHQGVTEMLRSRKK